MLKIIPIKNVPFYSLLWLLFCLCGLYLTSRTLVSDILKYTSRETFLAKQIRFGWSKLTKFSIFHFGQISTFVTKISTFAKNSTFQSKIHPNFRLPNDVIFPEIIVCPHALHSKIKCKLNITLYRYRLRDLLKSCDLLYNLNKSNWRTCINF